jgi:hypothetical protein
MHSYIHTFIHTYIYIHTYIHLCIHTYIDQAQQITILNVLEKLEFQDGQDNDKRAAIDADRKISLHLLQSNF